MKFRLFGCGKFRWLILEAEDRSLTAREQAFMRRHRSVCQGCCKEEEVSARSLNMLRSVSLEPEVRPTFEKHVIQKHKIADVRAKLGYWSPAMLGAMVAVLAVLAAMQLVARTNTTPNHESFNEGAHMKPNAPIFPDYDFSNNSSPN